MADRPRKSAALRKNRKSFVLSEDVLDFLEAEKRRRQSDSTSSVLEDLIRDYSRRRDSKTSSSAITRYYDSLSDEEQAEDRRWGEFAESQFPAE